MSTATTQKTVNSSFSSTPPLNITLGVELEFLIVKSFYPGKPPKGFRNKDHDLGRGLTHNVLSQPIPVRCSECGQAHDHRLPLGPLQLDNGNPAIKLDHDFWNVVIEGDLGLHVDEVERLPDKGQHYECNDGSHTHTITYQEGIRAVFNALQRAFNTPEGCTGERHNTRMVINDLCGLHVHVGNERKGFPPSTTKNILSIAIACERVIDSMHATHRIGGTKAVLEPPDLANDDFVAWVPAVSPQPYNFPLSAWFLQNAHFTRQYVHYDMNSGQAPHAYPFSHLDNQEIKAAALGFDAASFVDLIQLAPSLSSLKSMFNPRIHRSIVNIENLASDDPIEREHSNVSKHAPLDTDGHKMTIEFRQHAGTMSADEVLHSMEYVQSLVKFAHNIESDKLRKLCKSTFSRSDHTLAALLFTLRVPASTTSFYLNRRQDSDSVARAQEELKQIDAFGYEDPFRGLCRHLMEQRRHANSSAIVAARIAEKLRNGGYGQFGAGDMSKIRTMF